MSSQFGSKQEPLPIAGVESATGEETVIKIKSMEIKLRHEGVDLAIDRRGLKAS